MKKVMTKNMFDTIILESQGFYIPDPDKFSLNARQVLNSKTRFAKCQNNPSAEDKKKGIYKPRLTLFNRAGAQILKIEFSAPKLLYGNNLDELDESQFDEVVAVLQERLKEMGVMAWRKEIEKAKVTAFHPSKNIPLTGGYTASYIIKELYKLNVPKYLDINKADFRNNGHALQFYSAINAFVIYDKIADLTKPASRAIDKTPTLVQLDLFRQIQQRQLPLEILRLEVRLIGSKKINAVLAEHGYQPKPTFRDIFSQQLCKSIVQNYWQHHVQERDLCNLNLLDSPQQQLTNLIRRFPSMRPKRAIYLIGLAAALSDEEGVRGLRQITDKGFSKTNWQSLKQDAKQYLKDDSLPDMRGYDLVAKVLKDFHSYHLPDELQCKEK